MNLDRFIAMLLLGFLALFSYVILRSDVWALFLTAGLFLYGFWE